MDGVGFRWLVTGTEGELELTAPEMYWQMGHPEMRLNLKAGKSPVIEVDCAVNSDGRIAEVPFPDTNTARLYGAFLKNNAREILSCELEGSL